MIGMIVDTGLPLNQIHHPCCRPQGGFVTECLGTLQQGLFELVNLVGIQARLAASAARFLQTVNTLGLPRSVPAAGRLGADTQALGNRTLAEPTVKQFGSSKPSLLELVKIAFQSSGVSHAPLDTANLKQFTILYRCQ